MAGGLWDYSDEEEGYDDAVAPQTVAAEPATHAGPHQPAGAGIDDDEVVCEVQGSQDSQGCAEASYPRKRVKRSHHSSSAKPRPPRPLAMPNVITLDTSTSSEDEHQHQQRHKQRLPQQRRSAANAAAATAFAAGAYAQPPNDLSGLRAPGPTPAKPDTAPARALDADVASPGQRELMARARQMVSQLNELQRSAPNSGDDDDALGADGQSSPSGRSARGPLRSYRLPSQLLGPIFAPIPCAPVETQGPCCGVVPSGGPGSGSGSGAGLGSSTGNVLGAGAHPEVAGPPKIKILLKHKHGQLKVQIRPSDPARLLLDAFLQIEAVAKCSNHKGWTCPRDPAVYRLMFDGEMLRLDEPLSAVGLEDGEQVDVTWRAV